jgi:hypothetical protein
MNYISQPNERVGKPTTNRKGLREMHPYMINNFQGTPEIQKTRNEIYNPSNQKLTSIDFSKQL